ncbi:MAG TPA: ABC transporter substrate-binding protein [Candidatus Baltobacteraceae bacterium]|nr:ABC transporter substrate-binding protein [Candidatus Baltobacteraceae bacterium]
MIQEDRSRRAFLRDVGMAATVLTLGNVGSVSAGQDQRGLGAQLIGKLEGPELVLDPAKWPKRFAEAPMLAELVKSGKLPPIAQRLPEEPLVVKPVHSIGRYGGTWRRGFTGPADGENGNRLVSTDKLLFWDYTATRIMPCVARGWRQSDDGRVTAIFLRKGMKWSDGREFTADDFVFWYEDVYLNKELQPTPHAEFTVNGKSGRLYKADGTTVVFEFPEPNFLFVDMLAGSTAMGGGQATQQFLGRTMGAYMPAHYLKQFHPKYVAKDVLDRQVKAAGFDGWVSYIKNRWDWRLNPELPVLGPWKTITPINTPTWVLERNPYYYGVDTAGNQLPYIDRISMGLAENLEVLNLRAIAGQYDLQERHTSLSKLPVFLDNRTRGNYEVHLDPALHMGDTVLFLNHAYEADPEIAKWLQSRDFRRALSLGIDRDQLNETFWLGLGTAGSFAPAESVAESPGPEWRKKWSVHDPRQANRLLDQLGLMQKDAEGYRLRSDGKGRIRLELSAMAGQFINYAQVAEMIRDQWRQIGIQADVKDVERNLLYARAVANELQIVVKVADGVEQLFLYPRNALPVDPAEAFLGYPIARWYASDGQQGKPPKDPELLRVLGLLRTAPGKKGPERRALGQEIWRILVDNQYSIATVGQSPAAQGVRIVSRRMGNIPAREINAQHARTPCSSHPATFFFKA